MKISEYKFNKIAELLRTDKYTHAEIAKEMGFSEYTIRRIERQINRPQPDMEAVPYIQNMSKQPCWECKKAYSGCAWSRNFKPIPGWKAIQINLSPKSQQHIVGTYKIEECPEFEREQDPRDGLLDLVTSVVENYI